jgi:hypothetical protein
MSIEKDSIFDPSTPLALFADVIAHKVFRNLGERSSGTLLTPFGYRISSSLYSTEQLLGF